ARADLVLADVRVERSEDDDVHARRGDLALAPAGRPADLVHDVADDGGSLAHDSELPGDREGSRVHGRRLRDETLVRRDARGPLAVRSVAVPAQVARQAERALHRVPRRVRDLRADQVAIRDARLVVLRPRDLALHVRAMGIHDEAVDPGPDRVEAQGAEVDAEGDLDATFDRTDLVPQRRGRDERLQPHEVHGRPRDAQLDEPGLDHARGEGAPIDADLEPVRRLVDVREEDPADVEQAPHARVPGRDLTEQLAQGPPGARDDRQTHRCGLDDRHRAHDEHADDGQGEEDPREPSKSYHLPTLGRAKNFRYMTVTLSIEGIERHRGETVGEEGSIIVVVLRGRNAPWNPPGDMRDEPSPAGWRFPDPSFIGMRPSPTRRDRRSSRASASSWP